MGTPDGPPPFAPGAPPASVQALHRPAQGPPRKPLAARSRIADRDDSPRASASTYDRYLAGLADIAQVPFLFRFNAFPEAHLDSLENPAYATEFHSAEGRVFILPTFRGASTLQEYQSAFGTGGSLPSDYSVSPQVSFFAPAGGFTFGGSASVSQRRQHHPDRDAGLLSPAPCSKIRSTRHKPAARKPAAVPATRSTPAPWWRRGASAPTVSAWNWRL